MAVMVIAGCDSQREPPTTEEWECLDGFLGLPEARHLRPGVLDGDAMHVFTSGHCHSFAEALHRLHPPAELVFAFDRPSGVKVGLRGAQGHVLVRVEGRYLDARGWIDEQIEVEDGNRRFEEVWDGVLAIEAEGWFASGGGWLPMRVDDALPFAAALIERLGLATSETPEGAEKLIRDTRRPAQKL